MVSYERESLLGMAAAVSLEFRALARQLRAAADGLQETLPSARFATMQAARLEAMRSLARLLLKAAELGEATLTLGHSSSPEVAWLAGMLDQAQHLKLAAAALLG
jgi:hypothetical protein